MYAGDGNMNEDHSLQLSKKVLLWDGKMYPRARVEQELVGLSDYALAHESLTEKAPFEFGKTVLRNGLMILCITFIAGVLFFVATGDLLMSILTAFLLTVALAVLQGIGLVWTAKICRPTVSVMNGIVTLQIYGRNHEYTLDSFRWYRGKSKHDSLLAKTGCPNIQTIVLVTRVKFGWFPAMKYRIACGFTPETRARWEAFLKLSDIPHGESGNLLIAHAVEKVNQLEEQ